MNITIGNANEVISDLVRFTTAINETSDQNCDNLIVIADVLTQLANILLTQNVSIEVANLVSIKFLLKTCFQIFL